MSTDPTRRSSGVRRGTSSGLGSLTFLPDLAAHGPLPRDFGGGRIHWALELTGFGQQSLACLGTRAHPQRLERIDNRAMLSGRRYAARAHL